MGDAKRIQVDRRMGNMALCKYVRRFGKNG
jgi:hypothetical protein